MKYFKAPFLLLLGTILISSCKGGEALVMGPKKVVTPAPEDPIEYTSDYVMKETAVGISHGESTSASTDYKQRTHIGAIHTAEKEAVSTDYKVHPVPD